MTDDGYSKPLEFAEEPVVTALAGLDAKTLCRVLLRLSYVRQANALSVARTADEKRDFSRAWDSRVGSVVSG